MSIKITIEVDNDGNPSVSSVESLAPQQLITNVVAGKPDTDAAFQILVDARGNLKRAMEGGSSFDIDKINNWIGGGLAILAAMEGTRSDVLLQKLTEAAPVVTNNNPAKPSRVTFIDTERERAEQKDDYEIVHAGRQRSIDPSTLSDEEREDLGLFLPSDEESPEEDLEIPADDPEEIRWIDDDIEDNEITPDISSAV